MERHRHLNAMRDGGGDRDQIASYSHLPGRPILSRRACRCGRSPASQGLTRRPARRATSRSLARSRRPWHRPPRLRPCSGQRFGLAAPRPRRSEAPPQRAAQIAWFCRFLNLGVSALMMVVPRGSKFASHERPGQTPLGSIRLRLRPDAAPLTVRDAVRGGRALRRPLLLQVVCIHGRMRAW